MSKTDNTVLKDMIITMLLYGIIVQIVCLTGAVYSETRENIQRAKVEFQVGNLYFNRKSTAAVVLQHPFGGFNMSGTDAKTGTADYLTNFMNLKSITEDLNS